MEIYLSIITTVLVLTQVIRITQNAIMVHRQNKLFNKQCEEVRDIEIMKADFEMQRLAYKLIVDHFTKEEEESNK